MFRGCRKTLFEIISRVASSPAKYIIERKKDFKIYTGLQYSVSQAIVKISKAKNVVIVK